MPGSANQKELDQILVARENDTALVRINGRGSFKTSAAMKKFGTSMIECGAKHIQIDMSRCVGMDSTFMGVLAGLASKLRAKDGDVQLYNLTAHTRGLLSTLGLDQLVKAYMAESTPEEISRKFTNDNSSLSSLETGPQDQQQLARTMLEAHEKLVEICPDNLPKFKDVLTYLRDDIKKQSDAETG